MCLSFVSTLGVSLTSFQTSLLANLFDLWWDQLLAVLEISWGLRRCPASLPLVTNPCHYTLRAAPAYALCLSDLNRGSKSSLLQEGLEYRMVETSQRHLVCLVSAVMFAFAKHQNALTCLGLMALWKDFYIKRAVAKIGGLLIPVFIRACSSDSISIYFSVFWISSWSRSDSPWGRM